LNEAIFEDDEDRLIFLCTLAKIVARFDLPDYYRRRLYVV